MATVIVALVASGPALGSPPEKLPSNVPFPVAEAVKLSGTYRYGDGLGVDIHLTLKSDSSYLATWRNCGGLYGDASGVWSVQTTTLVQRTPTKALVLSPLAETGGMNGFLRTLDLVEAEGHLVFVRPDNRDSFKRRGVRPSNCFQRQE